MFLAIFFHFFLGSGSGSAFGQTEPDRGQCSKVPIFDRHLGIQLDSRVPSPLTNVLLAAYFIWLLQLGQTLHIMLCG